MQITEPEAAANLQITESEVAGSPLFSVSEAAGPPLFSVSAASAFGGLTFQSVSAGSQHSCGVTTAGAAYCWGFNAAGQLGNGTLTKSNVPVAASIPPALLLELLIADVQDLIDAGLLDQGGNGLLGILDAALASIQNDRPSASKQLNAFINAVEGFITGGLLTAEQGQALMDAAQCIIDQL